MPSAQGEEEPETLAVSAGLEAANIVDMRVRGFWRPCQNMCPSPTLCADLHHRLV